MFEEDFGIGNGRSVLEQSVNIKITHRQIGDAIGGARAVPRVGDVVEPEFARPVVFDDTLLRVHPRPCIDFGAVDRIQNGALETCHEVATEEP